jgi:hypothetical protein
MASTIVGGVHDATAHRISRAHVTVQPSDDQPATEATSRHKGEFHARFPAPSVYRNEFAGYSFAPLASTADLTNFQPAAFEWFFESSPRSDRRIQR